MYDTMSIIVSHGTLDALMGAVTLAGGAVAIDMPVSIFMTHDAVYALTDLNRPLPIDTAFDEVKQAYAKAGEAGLLKPWYEQLRDYKEMGAEIRVIVCGVSAQLFNITDENKPDFVDKISGVTDFISHADGLVITF